VNENSTEIKITEQNNQVPAFEISDKTSFSRNTLITWKWKCGHVDVPQRSKSRRRQERLLASSEIHGASKENRQPALDGMFCTLEKYTNIDDFQEYMNKSKKIVHASTTTTSYPGSFFEKDPGCGWSLALSKI
jgi:hypothetical protein